LQIVRRELINGIIGIITHQTSEAISLFMLRYHVIVFDRFCWLWSFLQAVSTLTNCASFTACSLKVQ